VDVVASDSLARSQFAEEPRRPVIIGGCPRSGTTLLRTMLHCHPELAIPRETRFVLESWRQRRKFGDLHKAANRRKLARWIFTRDKSLARRLGLDPETAIKRVVASSPTLGSALATSFTMYAEKHGKPRWGDKRPMYASRMTAIWDLFPNAQFINVVRDPRACVASLRKLGWYEGSIAPSVELWERTVTAVDRWRSDLRADQLLDVRYEELISDPESTLGQVAAFAGLASDRSAFEQMFSYHELKETRSQRYHSNLSRPIDASRVSAWTEVLEPPEIAFIEQATLPIMRQWGYEPIADGVSAPAELVGELTARRKRQAANRRKALWKDRVQKLVTHRQELAAIPVANGMAADSEPAAHSEAV
jgi:Sulfotransferase family